MLSQLSYKSHARAVVRGPALHVMLSGRNNQPKHVNSTATDIQQLQLNVDVMIDANAATTPLEKKT